MNLNDIWVKDLRNLQEQQLNGFGQINWLQGANGSGKTSFLEALFLLGNGRSFRTSLVERVVADGQSEFLLSAGIGFGLEQHRIGLSRSRKGESRLRVDGQDERKLSTLAALLPVQILTPETYQLLEAGPRERRRLLDWSVFHVEHSYVLLISRYNRLLQQRNAVLKQSGSDAELDSWDQQLAMVGEAIHQQRATVWCLIHALVCEEFEKIGLAAVPEASYFRGWGEEYDTLFAALTHQRQRDREHGSTALGPHRADIRIRIGRINASEKLSRGQAKMLVQALYIAVLKQTLSGKSGLLLLDDVGSELDVQRQQQLLEQTAEISGLQLFITSTLACPVEVAKRYNTSMFHVEHGLITKA